METSQISHTDWSADSAESLPSSGRLILMSGTPHQGSEARFKNLLRLISDDSKRLDFAAGRVIFRTKDRVRDWHGRPLFPSRNVCPPTVVQLGARYEAWYNAVGDLYDSSAMQGARGRASGWAKGQALQWAASSVQAGLGFLVRLAMRRLEWRLNNEAFSTALAALRPYRGGSLNEPLPDLLARLNKQIGAQDQQEDILGDDEALNDDVWAPDPDALSNLLLDGVALLRSAAASAKWDAVSSIIDDARGERIVLFAQPVETVGVVADYLERKYGRRPSIIIGNQSEEERRSQVAAFQADGGPRFLVSSRAGGEGLNMQRARRLINLDVPWNPMELEQRIGRIHRFGSRKTIIVDTVVAAGSREVDMYRIAREKLSVIARQIDPEDFELLFSRVMSLVAPEELEELMGGLRGGPIPSSVSDEIGKLVKKGYDTWQEFDQEYRSNAEKIQAAASGEATWGDFAHFLRRYCDAEEGPETSLTSFNFVNDEIVDLDEQLPNIAPWQRSLPVRGLRRHFAGPGWWRAGTPVGLNLEEVAARVRGIFLQDRVCGAGYLNRPNMNDLEGLGSSHSAF